MAKSKMQYYVTLRIDDGTQPRSIREICFPVFQSLKAAEAWYERAVTALYSLNIGESK
jgi:hypothetical protein